MKVKTTVEVETKRNNYPASFKAEVALAQGPVARISSVYDVHKSNIYLWRRQLKDRAELVFDNTTVDAEPQKRVASADKKVLRQMAKQLMDIAYAEG
jgi:transposase-like protein